MHHGVLVGAGRRARRDRRRSVAAGARADTTSRTCGRRRERGESRGLRPARGRRETACRTRWPRAGPAAQRRGRPGDPRRRARGVRRARPRGPECRRGRGARRGEQGDDLPPLPVEGRPRGVAKSHVRARPEAAPKPDTGSLGGNITTALRNLRTLLQDDPVLGCHATRMLVVDAVQQRRPCTHAHRLRARAPPQGNVR